MPFQIDGETLGALIGFAGLMAGGAYWIANRQDKMDMRNGLRVKELHQRLDSALLSMVGKDDHHRDVERIETSVAQGISELRGMIQTVLLRFPTSRGDD